MTIKEQIKAEIDNLRESDLDELYKIIKDFVQAKAAPQESSLMSRLRNVQIDAPEDFSINLAQYASGETNHRLKP